jgi:1-acyl-sn-glycerol-3-phosphate acyltransferase
LLQGAATVALLFPLLSARRRRALKKRWAAGLLRVLNIRLEPHGEQIAPGCLLVANHISWVDIFVINALAPSAFVSKDDVQSWPFIGWLAERNDTVFLRRGHRREAHRISEVVGKMLADGQTVAVFPEGTTTEGRTVRHFHSALLQPAIDAGKPIQALALAYRLPDGSYCGAPSYAGDTSIGESLRAILAQPEIRARLEVCSPLPAAGAARKALSEQARSLIAARIGGAAAQEHPDVATETVLTQAA